MNQWGYKFKFYLKLYKVLFGLSIKNIFIYRINALITGLAPIVWMGGVLIVASTIYKNTNTIGGWSYWEIILLTAIHEVIFLASWTLFVINLRNFVKEVNLGRFDQVLLKPVNPGFMISFRYIDVTNTGSLINVIILLVLSLNQLWNNIPPEKVLGFLILIIIAFWLCFLIYFIFACLAFFMNEGKTFIDIVLELIDFDRYPGEIYPVFLKSFLTFFIPILFLAYIPTGYLLGKLSEIFIPIGIGILLLFYIIAKIVWKAGLKRYQSASS